MDGQIKINVPCHLNSARHSKTSIYARQPRDRPVKLITSTNMSLGPLVAGHDRQFYLRIFYTSTGSNWLCPEVYSPTFTTAKPTLAKNIYIASKQTVATGSCRHIPDYQSIPKQPFEIGHIINSDQPCFSNASNCSIGTGLPNRYPWK
jgi:hypothetical protein